MIGVVAAAVLAAPWNGQTVLIGIGLVQLVIASMIRIGPNFWLFTAVITPAFVLFTSVSSDVATSAEQRVLNTLIGAALVLLASAIPCSGHDSNKLMARWCPPTVATTDNRQRPDQSPGTVTVPGSTPVPGVHTNCRGPDVRTGWLPGNGSLTDHR